MWSLKGDRVRQRQSVWIQGKPIVDHRSYASKSNTTTNKKKTARASRASCIWSPIGGPLGTGSR